MTIDNTGRTWRDFSSELTAEQIANLTERERRDAHEPQNNELLIELARGHAKGNRTDARFAHLRIPAGTVGLMEHWQLDPDDGTWFRYFEGPAWQIGRWIDVSIQGTQRADGAVDRFVRVESSGSDRLGADDARLLAEVLRRAAKEVEKPTVA